MRVLIVDESSERAEVLRLGLERAKHEVAAVLSSALDLLRAVERFAPDIIIVDTDSPSRDVIEHLVLLGRDRPRPIVMFANDAHSETIREAVRAGVTAYIVDGLDVERVKPIIDVALARFDSFEQLRGELAEANLKLSERKLVDRAKGLLMKARGVSEDEAYAQLRKLAMHRGQRLGEIARNVIDAAELLT